ncbi:MAG TPA: HAMP domain-containing sensor histidine kinase [Micromonosporaceae bacterium]
MIPPEQRLLTRTWRRIAAQTALVVAVVVVAVEALAAGLVLHNQHVDANRQVRSVFARPDPLDDPPPGIRVYRWRDGTVLPSRGAPAAPPDPASLTAVAGGGAARTRVVTVGDLEWLVRTGGTGSGDVFQVALDLGDQEHERHRLYVALALGGALGVTLSLLAGALLARRAVAPLGTAMARQRRFVADASHELRTPLTQLHTRAQLLDRQVRGDTGAQPRGDDGVAGPAVLDRERLASDVGALVRGTRQLGELVEDLLLAARYQAEPRQFDPVDLGTVAEQVVDAESVRAAERRLTLGVVPASDGPYLVRGAETALRRVLTSLVDNALGHTPPGGEVRIELCRDGDLVACTVRDNGEGFDPVDAERIFERFARGRHGDGRRFGLGLALVREVVEGHGGTVTASGATGRGAAFTVRLPTWQAPVQQR